MVMEKPSVVITFLFIAPMLYVTLECPNRNPSLNTSQSSTDNRVTLNIMGFFAMTGIYPAGMSYLPAALLAIKHINNQTDILPGYKLTLNAYDTMCDESQGLEAFYKEVYNRNRTSIMTLGATCSHVTEATAQVSTLWNITQISYSAISPHLSNRDIFKTFFRVMTPEQNLTVGRIKMMKVFNWNKVHIVYENFKLFSTLDEYMRQDLDRNDIDVISNEMFTTIKPRDTVLALKKNDARIIIANMYEAQARQIICAVYHLDGGHVWYRKLVWFLPYFYDRNWIYSRNNQDNCSTAEILKVLGNYFSVGSPSYIKDENYKTMLNISASDFYKTYINGNLYRSVSDEIPENLRGLYANSAQTDLFCLQRAPEAYDAMWAIAFALNNTLTAMIDNKNRVCLEDFRYRNETFWKLLEAGMMRVSFNAVTGPFSFNPNKERTTGIEIWQYNHTSTEQDSNMMVVGQCQFLKSSTWDCRVYTDKVHWVNGIVPVDGVQVGNLKLTVDQRIVYTVCGLASLGILLSLGLLVFNIVHRNHRVIKMSSPRLNNVILVGCILGYSNILVLDVQGEDTGVVCILRTFTVVLSFSLTFGALFAKTWRVYEIFAAGAKVLNTRMLRDSSLFLIVTILILVNCLTLVGWVVASPQKPTNVTISVTPATENNDVNYTNVFQRCESTYRRHFTWALVAIQGGVILLGTYLAIQTRKVTCPDLNDSKSIALCIYNVVVLGPVGVIVVMATEDKPEINYALEAGMLILVTTMTQGLIFVPKIVAYRKHNRKNHTQSLDITFKLRNMDEIIGIFTLDPSTLDRETTDATKPKENSGSCEVSQQTDFSSISCQDTCPCPLKHAEVNSQDKTTCGDVTSDEEKKTRHERTHMSVLFHRVNNKQTKNQQCLNSGKFHSSDYSLDSVNMQRSRSESSLNGDSLSGSLHHWSDPRPRDSKDVDGSLKDDDDKMAVFWGNLTLLESNNFSSAHDDSQRRVFDTIKVKAELKVSSKLGLRASWTEGPGHLNNAKQICELLSRLKQAVEAGEDDMKT